MSTCKTALEAHYPHPPAFPLDMLANVPDYLWWVTSSASVYSSIVQPRTFVHTYVGVFTIMQMWDLHTCIYKRHSEMSFLNFIADMSQLSHLSGDWNLQTFHCSQVLYTCIYNTAHTSTLSCFLPHIHLSCSYIRSPFSPLPAKGRTV